jgi:hemerythrin-like metal-binding protein
MAFFDWSDEYSVANSTLDAQHQQLFAILNRLHDALTSQPEGNNDRLQQDIMSALLEYTRTHFAEEEEMMLKSGYPGYDRHREAHLQLIAQVEEMGKRLEKGDASLREDVFSFLFGDWLLDHILNVDSQYVPYLH